MLLRLLKLKKGFIIIIFLISLLLYVVWSYNNIFVPSEYTEFEGENKYSTGILPSNGLISIEKKSNDIYKIANSNSYKAQVKLLGLVPLKEIEVTILPKKEVVACGGTIGVKLFADGLLIVGVSGFVNQQGRQVCPALDSGIRTGDIIIAANGKKLKSIEQLNEILAKNGEKAIELEIEREKTGYNIIVTPQSDKDNAMHRIGLWVRDSAAGIGTLTFYNPESKYYAALGHGIIDGDTGQTIKVSHGVIQRASIIQVKKGESGRPGELKGMFVDGTELGDVRLNNQNGIYGEVTRATTFNGLPLLTVASRNVVKEGQANIFCTVEGEKIDRYDIEIQKVMPLSSDGSKGMIIKVTDPRLLKLTGGIVQGMSGSPIMQDNKLIGAVTHVFINDPTRGYGAFIDSMLRHAG